MKPLENSTRAIDHIVYAVPDLEAAMDWFEKTTGIRPSFGGYHTNQGTKNAVVRLGEKLYLEILAVDADNKAVGAPRWMGVDVLTKPQITRWAIKSSDLKHDSLVLKKHTPELGKISGGERKMTSGKLLKWEMILPLAKPEVDLIPFMTDWQHSSVHPADQLTDDCQLLGMQFSHPEPWKLSPVFNKLLMDIDILKKGKLPRIQAKIRTPKGIIQL